MPQESPNLKFTVIHVEYGLHNSVIDEYEVSGSFGACGVRLTGPTKFVGTKVSGPARRRKYALDTPALRR